MSTISEQGERFRRAVDQDDPMNTNDEQAPYGKPTERAPLMSDDRLAGLVSTDTENLPRYVGEGVRNFYEARITSGELRVVKKPQRVERMGDDGFTPCILCIGCGMAWVKGSNIGCEHNECLCGVPK